MTLGEFGATRRGLCLLLVVLVQACSGDAVVPPQDAAMDALPQSDGGGLDAGADVGSTPDAFLRPDSGGCAIAPDVDGDHHNDVACGGDDCDDGDANRFPGNTEVCDTHDHDEDCDPSTYGVRDADMDGFPDARCCNVADAGVRMCGTDCDDTRSSAHPTSVEVCNSLDDDCDTAIDEGVTVTFWTDADHDGHGNQDAATATMGCAGADRPGYASTNDDCDDTRSYVHPGLPESCDLGADAMSHDENCDGSVDEGCACIGAATQSCSVAGAVGACAAGVETCVGGRFSTCSITPQPEVCNGTDDNCDGHVDEGTIVVCYPDVDGDTYAPMAAAGTSVCQVSGRSSVGGCPPLTTNRMPTAGGTDCDDMRMSSSPAGMEGTVCNNLDDDCNGTRDDGLTFTCYVDNDDDGYASAGTAAMQLCPDPTRGVRGFCPFRTTNRAPTAGMTDCNDMTGVGAIDFPGAPEVCDAVDNDCDAIVDETTMVNCYTDADNDSYSPTGSAVAVVCRVVGRDAFGGCPLNRTYRTPASAPDCDDANPTRFTGAIETCNSVDDDCDTRIDEGSRVTCYPDADDDSYAVVGASAMSLCADSMRTMVAGCPLNTTNRMPTASVFDCQPSDPLSHPGGIEICDMLDNDCDMVVDNGVPRASCYVDTDDDNLAPMSAAVTQLCPVAGRASHGNCPLGYTGNMPNTTTYDCADSDPSRVWANVTCWQDDDGDGFACPTMAAGALPSYSCRAGGAGAQTSSPIPICPHANGHCDAGYTSMDPGTGPVMSLGASDCNDGGGGGTSHTWQLCYRDVDGDGHAGGTTGAYVCTGAACPSGTYSTVSDCDDSMGGVFTPRTCYRDADTDGYGGAASAFCLPSCPSGYVTTSTDCCDSDMRAHPGVTAWLTTARTTCGGYDFNCDGTESREFPAAATFGCSYVTGEGCVFTAGNQGYGSPPACGVSGTFYDDCAPTSPSSHVCARTGSATVQPCH